MITCICSHALHLGVCEEVIERNHVEDICACLNSIFEASDVRELRRKDAAQQRSVDKLKAAQPKSRTPRKPAEKYKRFKLK